MPYYIYILFLFHYKKVIRQAKQNKNKNYKVVKVTETTNVGWEPGNKEED